MNKPLFTATVTLGAVSQVFAQTATQTANPPAHLTQPVITTQYLMQNNGGSLLQATQTPTTTTGDAPKAQAWDNVYAINPPEPHVLKKHDLINIVVNQESKSQSSGTSDQQREANWDAKIDSFVKFNLARLTLRGTNATGNPPEIKMSSSRDFKGQGEYDRTDTMTTRLEAEVIDVKPNGTLVVQARQHIKIDEEEISVSLTGTCRVQDVDAANSVLSSDLQDLDLQKKTSGQVHDTNKRSLIHGLLDFLNPF